MPIISFNPCNPAFKLALFLQILVHYTTATSTKNPTSFFIENRGQWEEEVLFRTEIPSGYILFQKSGVTYVFYDAKTVPHHFSRKKITQKPESAIGSDQVQFHVVKMEFLNAALTVKTKGSEKLIPEYNYYLGNDPNRWASRVGLFSKIIYQNIYEGIDAIFYQSPEGLKYDFVVSPEADPSRIRMYFEGMEAISLINDELKITTSLQEIRELAPLSFQGTKVKHPVESAFVLLDNIVTFCLGEYDITRPLTIDPSLVFSTFSGSTADNWGFTAAFDDAGNTYSGGAVSFPTGNGSIPTTPGAYSQTFSGGTWDIALFKYDSTGTNLLSGTYLGGSQDEYPHSLVVGNAGNLLILGSTGSSDFPVSASAFDNTFAGGQPVTPLAGLPFNNGSDLFITKLSGDGTSLIGSTFLGGSDNDGIGSLDPATMNIDQLVKNYGDQFRGDIIIDSDDNVYVASNTNSNDFPVVSAFQNTFGGGKRDGTVTKLSNDLSTVIWSSYLGGSDEDVAYSIKVVQGNNVLISGGTASTDFPNTSSGLNPNPLGGIDGFAALISPDGTTLQAATYLGTVNDDQAYFTDVDVNFNVYVLGQTQGNYPVTSGVFFNPNGAQFVHKLSPDLTTTIFSTKFGSGTINSGGLIVPDISPTAFLVSECNTFYLAGWGSSQISTVLAGYQGLNLTGLPLTNNAFQTSPNNGAFYMAVFEENAEELIFGSYFGGSVAPSHVDGGTSRFDKRGIMYQAVCSCGGASDDFPTSANAWSTTNNSFPVGGSVPRCNNAVFKFDLATLEAQVATNSPLGDSPGLDDLCLPDSILFVNESSGGQRTIWNLGDGTVITDQDSLVHIYEEEGVYVVTLTVEDESTCQQVDETSVTVNIREGDFSFPLGDRVAICEETSIQLLASGADNYTWTPNDTSLQVINEANPVVSPTRTTNYALEATTSDGCLFQDTVEVRLVPRVASDFEWVKDYNCMEFPTFSFTNLSIPSESLTWSFGDGTTTSEENPVYQYDSDGDFMVSLETQNEFCSDIKTEIVRNDLLFLPNVITPNNDFENDVFFVPNDGNLSLSITNRYGNQVFETADYQNDWGAEDLSDGVYYYQLTFADSSQTHCRGIIHVIR